VFSNSSLQTEVEDQRSNREDYEIDYYFNDYCFNHPIGKPQLCRIKTNNKRQVEKTFLDQFHNLKGIGLISFRLKKKPLTMLVKI